MTPTEKKYGPNSLQSKVVDWMNEHTGIAEENHEWVYVVSLEETLKYIRKQRGCVMKSDVTVARQSMCLYRDYNEGCTIKFTD